MDTLSIVKDTIAVTILKAADNCKQCVQDVPTNEYDVKIVGYLCAAIVIVTLIVVISLYLYSYFKCKISCRQHNSERNEEKKDELLSLRKEYQNTLIDYFKTRNDAKEINKEYVEELRNCIIWIDSQIK